MTLTASQIADRWKPHDGGECPVEGETVVEVKFRSGVMGKPLKAKAHDWMHLSEVQFADIIAYKEQSHDD